MTIMTTPPKDQTPEALRTHFEALASDPSFKLSRSRRGTYVNPAVARDWKWFQRGASHAQQPEPAAPSAAAEVENLRKALQFYADKDHFTIADDGAWDTVSGEPQNYWCDEEGTATVEDGTIARLALAGHPIKFDADEAPQPSPTPQADSAPSTVTVEHAIRIAESLGVREYGPNTRNWSFDYAQLARFVTALTAPQADSQPAAQQKAPADELEEVLRERDDAEDFINELLDEVLGADRPEWSSAYNRYDAMNDVRERITALHKPAVDKAWGRFESAMAAPQPSPTPQADSQPAPVLDREAVIRAAVAAMPHTNPMVADDLLGGFTMHTEADDVIAIFEAGRAARKQGGA